MFKNNSQNKKKSFKDHLNDANEELWIKEDFKKLVFKERHLAPKTHSKILYFSAEINAFILFGEKNKKILEKEFLYSLTLKEYIKNYRNSFLKELTTDEIKQCNNNYGGTYWLLRNVTDVIHKFKIPKHVIDNCNEFSEELLNLNYIQLNIIQNMFNISDYNWTMLNFFTNPENISKGEKPTAYAHFFQELTKVERDRSTLTMKDYINLNLASIDLNTFLNYGSFKSIPSQIACYQLGNRNEGLLESAIFSEIGIYSTVLQLGVEVTVKTFISLSEYFEEYIKVNNMDRRSTCEQAYKKLIIPQYIIDSIIIDENKDMPLEWAVELHMEELHEELLKQFLNITNK